MVAFASAALLLAAMASQVSAGVYITSPVASTSCTAGQTCTVSWADDGNTPLLAAIGPCQIDLATGSQTSQFVLQNISPSLDVSTNAQVTFTPTAADGPNGNPYFVKFTSLGLKDATNPQFPYTAFSAKFTLAGMTGTFNSTIAAAVSAAALPAAASTAAASPSAAAATTPAAATTKPATSAAASGTTHASSTTSAKSTAKASSGAVAVTVPGVVSSVTGVTVLMSFASLFFGMLAIGL